MSLILFFITGAVVGSFLNVCIYRLPRGESIVFPSSHCPSCKHALNMLDLIPVFGYLSLQGKCRYCQAHISWRYPLVELITASLFVLIAGFFPAVEIIFLLFFVSILIAIFFIDLEHQVIPDVLTFLGLGIGLLYNLRSWNIFVSGALGMAAGYLVLAGIGYFGKILFKKEALGEGDLFLGALLGVFLGWEQVIFAILLAYVLAAGFIIPFMLLKKISFGEYIAFGPALVVAGIITLFIGQNIISWYLFSFLGL